MEGRPNHTSIHSTHSRCAQKDSLVQDPYSTGH